MPVASPRKTPCPQSMLFSVKSTRITIHAAHGRNGSHDRAVRTATHGAAHRLARPSACRSLVRRPEDHVAWARSPPPGGSHAIIAVAGLPVGYLRWQRACRETLDTLGLSEIPENSVDVDLFLGERSWLGKGIGPKALALLLALLRDDASIALVGVSTSVENVSARRAFEKAGFRVSRQYSPPRFGACYLLLASLR